MSSGFFPDDGIVENSLYGLTFRHHPKPFNEQGAALASIISDMAIEFTFYHELGHLLGEHSAFVAQGDSAKAFHELSALRENTGTSITLLHALEYEADHFAIQTALSNGLMLDYIDETSSAFYSPNNLALGNSRWIELSYYCWAMAVSSIFRLFSQQGLDIATYGSRTHPHPLTRAVAVGLWVSLLTALQGVSNRDWIIDVCARAPLDLSRYWREFKVPGHQYDPVANRDLLEDAAVQLASAIETILPLQEQLSRFERVDIIEVLTNGARTDPSLRGQ